MLIISKESELKAIKTLTSGSEAHCNWLLGKLKHEHFGFKPAQEAFRRIIHYASKKGDVITWNELLEDPGITKEIRDYFKDVKPKAITLERNLHSTFNTLEKYRQIRCANEAMLFIDRELNKENLPDINKVLDGAAQIINKSFSNINQEDCIFDISGEKGNQMIKDLIAGRKETFIATGFKNFDERNSGFFEGSLVVIAAPTGGGKSTISLQLSKNIALGGHRVCYVPLEMSEFQMSQRRLSNLTGIDLIRIVNPTKLIRDEVIVCERKWKAYQEELRLVKGEETFYVPSEDLTLEQIFRIIHHKKFKCVIIDYIGLLGGVGGDNQWQKLMDVARYAKVWANNNKTVFILCAQLDSDSGSVRYSRGIQEHANNMWSWSWDENSKETGIVVVKQNKARNQQPFDFPLKMNFATMTVEDVDVSKMPQAQPTKNFKNQPKQERASFNLN